MPWVAFSASRQCLRAERRGSAARVDSRQVSQSVGWRVQPIGLRLVWAGCWGVWRRSVTTDLGGETLAWRGLVAGTASSLSSSSRQNRVESETERRAVAVNTRETAEVVEKLDLRRGSPPNKKRLARGGSKAAERSSSKVGMNGTAHEDRRSREDVERRRKPEV